MNNLADTTLIMLVAPSAMGKSTIVSEVCQRDERFGRVRSFTTRSSRPDDKPEQFFYFTPQELGHQRAAGEIVTEVTFPTTGQTYGTIRDSFSHQYCLLETLAHSVDTYRALPFKRTVTISITSPANLWQQRFRERYPARTDDAVKRLDEAQLSIKWSLAQTHNHHWVINNRPPEAIADTLIGIALDKQPGDNGRADAAACLARIPDIYS